MVATAYQWPKIPWWCWLYRHRLSFYFSLVVQRTLTSFGNRSFTAGPRLWNTLTSTMLRQLTSYGQFRRHLKAHLFRAHCDVRYFAPYKYSYLLTWIFLFVECVLWTCASSVKVWDLRKSYISHKTAASPKHVFPYAGTCVRSHGLLLLSYLILDAV